MGCFSSSNGPPNQDHPNAKASESVRSSGSENRDHPTAKGSEPVLSSGSENRDLPTAKGSESVRLSGSENRDHPTANRSESARSSTGSGWGFYSHINASEASTESDSRISFPSSSRRSDELKAFGLDELRVATRNFSRSLMIGEGGFGSVFRGVLRSADEQTKRVDIAVKQLSRRGLQGHKEWVTEVNVLGVVEHPNLVKLIGYCAEDHERGMQRLLVYEYMPNHSVQDHLFNRFRKPLPWLTRLKIARDSARGLSYLHEGMDFQVVGTAGYAAPEYVQTGRLTYKSDVWSFGIFLYELMTGRRPLDLTKPREEQSLLCWLKPHLTGPQRLDLIMDPRLEGQYSLKAAQKLVSVANKCLTRQPRLRPRMREVLDMVSEIVDEAETWSPDLTPFSAEKRPRMQRRWSILSCAHG